MTKELPESEERAALYLRRALTVTNVDRRSFPPGLAAPDGIITTNRFILVLQGALHYTVEGRRWTVRAGTQILVPAWARRLWSVPRGGMCENIWCEFDEGGTQPGWNEFLQRKLTPHELRLEKYQYGRLHQLFLERQSRKQNWNQLRMEGELKAMLARFLESAAPPAGPRPQSTRVRVVHPAVKAALLRVSEHYREPGALETLYRESGMSRNYFRILFREAMQCSPQEFIGLLRLRQARHLLHDTNWQLKRIAVEVGYDDPLYFSRLYRRFWKIAPSEERESRINKDR